MTDYLRGLLADNSLRPIWLARVRRQVS